MNSFTRNEMAEVADAEKVEKLKKFIEETSADNNVASYYLQFTNWNLEAAITGFKQLKLAEERRIESRGKYINNDSKPASAEIKRNKGRDGPLRRGISMANTDLVATAREKMTMSEFSNRLDTSFVLPNITIVREPGLADFLKNDLIDKATYHSLTKADVLNWWAGENVSACRKLFPMSTVGDGNCLLHAVSLAMFGFHDRLLTLRRALHKSLATESGNGALKRRWMYQQWKLNMEAGGLSFTHQEWEDEWAALVRLASDRPRNHNIAASPTRKISKQYSIATTAHHDDSLKRTDSQRSDSFESLEEFHVFALAHVLRRPIIVVSDVMLRDLEGQPLQPIHFGGIYVPIECDPSTCCKYPVVLGYDSGHFAALVPAEGEDFATNKATLLSNVPVTRRSLELLPLHFIIDPGINWTKTEEDSKKKRLQELPKEEKLSILSKYLHITKVIRTTKGVPIISSLQTNSITEYDLDASDLGSLYRKKSKEGKPFVTKAFESITTLVTGFSNGRKASPHIESKISEQILYTAKLNMANKPEYFDEMVENYIASSRRKVHEKQGGGEKQPSSRVKCATPGCTFFGTSETNFLCSKCYKYQLDMSKVHKSMPSLQDDQPTLLKTAKRQLSHPERVESDEPLINFDDSVASQSFRPATAPPQDIVRSGDPIASNDSFDSMLDRVLFSQNKHSNPAPYSSIHRQSLPEKSASTSLKTTEEPNSHSFTHAQSAEFGPPMIGSTQSSEKPSSFGRGICRGFGCKVFGARELDGLCYSCFSRIYSEL